MRTLLGTLAVSVAATWTVSARAQLQPPPPMTAPAPAWPQLPGSPFGLPAAPPPQAPNATTQQLDAGDTSGSFRGLEIAYANADVGGGYASFGKNLGGGKSGEGGAAFGLGAGARFITWTLGARVRLMPASDFTLIQATLEAGYHLPMGAWDPYVNLHGGYSVASAKSVDGFSPPSPHGVDLGVSIGDDYYFSALFSVGLDVTFDTLFLSRSASEGPQLPATGGSLITEPTIPSASAVGVVLIGSAHAGLHFDL